MSKRKNNVVPFHLVGIETHQYASFPEQYDSNNINVGIKMEVQFKLDCQQKILGAATKFEFVQNDKTVLLLESSCHFLILDAYWEKIKEGNNVVFPQELLTHFLVLAVGTARGIIHAKKPKAMMNIMLPTINVLNTVESDVSFDLTAEDEEE